MLNQVLKRSIINNIKRYEGMVDHFYLDTRGNVTVGVGFLVSHLNEALALPMSKGLGYASAAQKEREYMLVRQLPYGQRYSARYYRAFTQLHLAGFEIDLMLEKKIAGFYQELGRLYPLFDYYPDGVKEALFDMIFNLGAVRLGYSFPRFNRFVREQNWAGAASESHRLGIGEVRNQYVQKLLVKEAIHAIGGLDMAS